jgi:hypothetical protein
MLHEYPDARERDVGSRGVRVVKTLASRSFFHTFDLRTARALNLLNRFGFFSSALELGTS